MPARQPPSMAFRLAAAALAGAPLGFAGGALLGGRLLTNPSDPAAAGTTLACAAFGALFAAGSMVLAVLLLAPKSARVATLVGGVASIAVVVYAVQDFVSHRMAQARAFDAAYQRMPSFELTLTAESAHRRPFSKLQFQSETRQYTAHRPGGWLCRGLGTRKQALALFEGLGQAADGQEPNGDAWARNCQLLGTWRVGAASVEACLDVDGQAVVAAADTLIEATERRSSCRRAPPSSPPLSPGEDIWTIPVEPLAVASDASSAVLRWQSQGR